MKRLSLIAVAGAAVLLAACSSTEVVAPTIIRTPSL